MKVLLAGSPEVAVEVFQKIAKEHEILGVLTMPDKPNGRGRAMMPTAVKQLALQNDWPVFEQDPGDEHFIDIIQKLAVDAVVVVAYGRIIKSNVLDIPKFGWINLHFSLLPSYRGAAPVQRAIIDGEKLTGVSVFEIDQGMDTGPVYAVKPVQIKSGTTSGELFNDLIEIGGDLFLEVLSGLQNGTALKISQDKIDYKNILRQLNSDESLILPSKAPKITQTDARIDWDKPATDIVNLVLGCNPKPLAWTMCNGKKLQITACRVALVNNQASKNTANLHLSDNGSNRSVHQNDIFPCAIKPSENDNADPNINSNTSTASNLKTDSNTDKMLSQNKPPKRAIFPAGNHSFIELVSVKPEGKKNMPAKAWLNGLQTYPIFE